MALTEEDKEWIKGELQTATQNAIHTSRTLLKVLEQSETRLLKAIEESEHRSAELAREMQTELLRGFASFSGQHTIRLRKVEADQSNLDAALSGRMDLMETRWLEIEKRLALLMLPRKDKDPSPEN